LIDVFWIDERCVNQKTKDSNYGQAYRALFENYDGVTLYPIFNGGNLINEAMLYQNILWEYISANRAFNLALIRCWRRRSFCLTVSKT
jgi:6-phosphogluconolactonase/glucosamine-6-phosphate isomerase/deaminase